ncbi:MAG: hypothetical protein ACO1SX_07890 [Actinomycetota bacterium]
MWLRTLLWDNPVARHAGRMSVRKGWQWGVLGILAAAGTVGALLQSYWMEMELYSFLRPQMATRWLGLTLIAETAVALPWAAARGALLWRQIVREGHLDEYRRSRMSAPAIAAGAIQAALHPVLVLLVVSLFVCVLANLFGAGMDPRGMLTAHGLLLVQAIAFSALGVWLAGRVRYPALAIPLAIAVLGAAVGAIWAIDPYYRGMGDPSPWIYAALLPNPVTAVGNALNTDVLRFSWIYERIHAHEYFFVYPPAWQTAGVYALPAVLLWGGVTRNIARAE